MSHPFITAIARVPQVLRRIFRPTDDRRAKLIREAQILRVRIDAATRRHGSVSHLRRRLYLVNAEILATEPKKGA